MKKLIILSICLGMFAITATAQTKFSPYRPEFLANGLSSAASKNDTKNIQKFIKHGADINAIDSDGNTALMAAAITNSVESIRLLISLGADVNAKGSDGDTALILAAAENSTAAAKQLIKYGADINAQNIWGMTALMSASLRNNIELVKLLIKRGADVNVQEKLFGDTALMEAARRGYQEITILLVEGGADIRIKNGFGQTAMKVAILASQPEVAELIKQTNQRVKYAKVKAITARLKQSLSNQDSTAKTSR